MLMTKVYGLAAALLDAVSGGFTDDQITSVSTSLQTAITNVLNMFVKLLPVLAIICGVGFGIRFVYARFRDIKNGR